jgi:N-glycosylase/DNA lyase
MSALVTEQDLSRARRDKAFRQQLMADNLERLLEALRQMREAENPSPQAARQMREGVALAVKLAERLQKTAFGRDPAAA